jgi:hypothetical protein
MERYPDHRTEKQIELFEKMADELPLDHQRELLSLVDTDTSTTDIEPWQQELINELRRDEFFADTVTASIPATL